MTDHLTQYFLAALAFAFVVTWATLGAAVAFLALLACAAVLFAPRLRRPAVRRTTHPRRRLTATELVPDDPSLILTVGQ